MINSLKALIVIYGLAAATFSVAGKALPDFIAPSEYKNWRISWYMILFFAFIAYNIWIFAVITMAFCLVRAPKADSSRVAYFLALFCILPLMPVDIPGAFGVRIFFKINYILLIILALFTGLYVKSRYRWFKLPSDRYVILYFLLVTYLSFRDDTFTNGLRDSFVIFISFILPYFVISRCLTDLSQLNKALFALFLGILPLTLIGCFESLRHWHLYDTFVQQLKGKGAVSGYDMRSGGLRATTVFGSPIILGFVMVIIFGIYLYILPLMKNQRFTKWLGYAIVACLLATISRGPWLGFVCLCFAYLWSGRGGAAKIAGWSLAVVSLLPVLAQTALGKTFLDLLPFVGNARADTVDYRGQLLHQAIIVINRNLWLGSTDYLKTPEMQAMRQGQGIIDIVNSYIQIILEYGLFGLSFFLAIFVGLLWRCYFILRRIPEAEADLLRMGRALFATLASILLMIATVSSIDYVAFFYWTFAGITAAYLNVAEKSIKKTKVSLI